MDSLVIETAIGLLFVFAVFAALVSLLTEAVSRLIGLRGEYLLRGIRSLVDDGSTFRLPWGDLFRKESGQPDPPPPGGGPPMVSQVLEQPIVARSGDKGSLPANAGNAALSAKARRALPSYVSGRSFARALLGILVPDQSHPDVMQQIASSVSELPDGGLKRQLTSLIAESRGDIDRFRRTLEEWYDDHMARVSGWYKRHVRWISLGLGAVLVLAFNVSAIDVTRSLYTDEVLRASVVTQATDAAQCENKEPAACLVDLREQIEQVRGAGLPIGWGTVSDCAAGGSCDLLERVGLTDPDEGVGHDLAVFALALLGWTLMVAALLPGARFWFDALSRLGTLRSTGPKPESA